MLGEKPGGPDLPFSLAVFGNHIIRQGAKSGLSTLMVLLGVEIQMQSGEKTWIVPVVKARILRVPSFAFPAEPPCKLPVQGVDRPYSPRHDFARNVAINWLKPNPTPHVPL